VEEAPHAEERRAGRRRCALPIELRTVASPFPLISETSDISVCGCYVTLLSTFRVGSQVDITLWTGDKKLTFRGTIKTADANVGNGIEFTGINEEQRTLLQRHLDETAAPAAKSDFIFR